MTALIQNFSVPADNDVTIDVQVSPEESLDASALYWRVYPQAFGIPDFMQSTLPSPSPPPAPLIEKSTRDGSILVTSSPLGCQIYLNAADTADLLRNYYHETTLVDPAGNLSTLNCGIVTVTDTRNRL
jgi:hypothetical protein